MLVKTETTMLVAMGYAPNGEVYTCWYKNAAGKRPFHMRCETLDLSLGRFSSATRAQQAFYKQCPGFVVIEDNFQTLIQLS